MRIATLPARPQGIYSAAVAARNIAPLVAISVCLLAAGVLSTHSTGLGAPNWWAPPVLAAAIFAAELFLSPNPTRPGQWSLSPFDIALAAGLVAAPGGWLTVTLVLPVIASRAARGANYVRLLYNGSALLLATAAGPLVTLAIGDSWTGPMLGLLVVWLYWSATQAVTFLVERGGLGRPFIKIARAQAYRSAVNFSLGLLIAHAAMHSAWMVACLALPMAALTGNRVEHRRRQDVTEMLGAVLRSQHSRQWATSLDVGRSLLLSTEALLGIRSADVRVFLCPPDRQWKVVSRRGRELVVTLASAETAHLPAVLSALGQGDVSVGHAGAMASMSAVVDVDGTPSAVVLASWPGRPTAEQRRRFERLGAVLIENGAAWLAEAHVRSFASDASLAKYALDDDQSLPPLEDLREAAQTILSITTNPLRVEPEDLAVHVQAASSALARMHGTAAVHPASSPLARRAPRASVATDGDRVRVGTLPPADLP